MPNQPDGSYDNTKPWRATPAWSYMRPWASNEERLTQQAINAALVPGQQLQDLVRPPLPEVQLFRPKFGYRVREIGIADVANVDRVFQANDDFSGTTPGATGAPRNSWGSGTW